MSSSSPAPSYHEEPQEGETTLQEPTLVPGNTVRNDDRPEDKKLGWVDEELKPKRAAPPVPRPPQLPPVTLDGPGSALPTPLPYTTPLQTPFTTAPNTPMFFGAGQAFPYSVPVTAAPMTQLPPQYMMPSYQYGMQHAMAMQPMAMMPPPVPQPQQTNGGINVVVNANAKSGAEAGGLTAPDGTKLKICPACKKGIIVREQDRKRAGKLKALACLTSCCLCFIPCLFLRCNFVDQCPSCGCHFGKRGGKKAKKPKYA